MKLLVILTTCAVCLDLITAKSTSSANQEIKVKGSSKLNSISTTPKPENIYSPLQQQQYRQQNYPQQPPPPQYQIQTQPQRLVQGHPQQIFFQQAQAHQIQVPQAQLQQSQLQQALHAQLQAQLQPHLQQLQPQLQHVIQKAYIIPQQENRPAAMILIAQPAYVPPHLVYGGGANQQVLSYVRPNAQARYQLPQGGNQAQVHQIPQQVPSHSVGNYQVVAVPAPYQQNVVAVPAPVPQSPHLAPVPQATHLTPAVPVPVQQPSPLQLAQIAHLATQQYSRINPSPPQQQAAPSQHYNYQSEPRVIQEDLQASIPVGSIPPIITGFENFTPDQQEKIKAQLSAYFGAPLQPLPNPRGPANAIQEGQGQEKERSQYTQKYQADQARLRSSEFIPSEQVKEDASASSSNVFRSHYASI